MGNEVDALDLAASLESGDHMPRMLSTALGPRALAASAALARFEAPGVNALSAAGTAQVWLAARGANVIDVDGNRFIDLTAGFGVAAVGHCHPRVIEAIERQGRILLHGLGDAAAHPLRATLAEQLGQRTPIDDPLVYWAISGADAVEIAIKTALLATKRPGILVFDPSYHGTTLGALAASSRPAFRQPFSAHLHPHTHRLPFACRPSDIRGLLERTPIACVLVEPIVGREGIRVPPDGWLNQVAEACRLTSTLLVVDEIFTGFGRTGSWFASEQDGVRPDLLCCGKALGGGLPIAAVVGRRDAMEAWQSPGEARHTATFLAHPLACAAAIACLSVIEQERLPERARRLGQDISHRIVGWPDRFHSVTAVQGRGLLWGIETKRPEQASRLAARAWQEGLLVLAGGANGRMLQIAPPLVITKPQIDRAFDLIEALLVAEFS